MRKRIVSIFLVLMMMSSMFTSFAEEAVIEINVEDAVESALADTTSVDNIKDGIETLWEQYGNASKASRQIQDFLDTIERFKELYKQDIDGYVLTNQEQAELAIYNAMFGNAPPKYTGQQMLDQFISGRDFPKPRIYAEIQKLRNTRDSLDSTIDVAVRGLYLQMIGLQNGISIQNDLLDINISLHESLKLKYETGVASEHDLAVSATNLQIQWMELEKLKNTFYILELNFKQLADLELSDDYIYVDTISDIEDIKSLDVRHTALDYYLDRALKNRIEIKNAKADQVVKESEYIITKHYLRDDRYTDVINASLAADAAADNVLSAEELVTQNIYDGYIDVASYWNDYNYNLETLEYETNKYNNYVTMYELGQLAEDNLVLLEFQYKMAEENLKTSIRNYINAVYKLDRASGLGPAY